MLVLIFTIFEIELCAMKMVHYDLAVYLIWDMFYRY
jgi:hypothetical protein